jgi:large subunit ribosomal protein L7/L12
MNINIIIKNITKLNLLELSKLIQKLEKIFNLKIEAPLVHNNLNSEKKEEKEKIIETKTIFDVILTTVPMDKKIAVLKVVRSITGLGLKESKEVVDNVPKKLKEGISKEECESIIQEIEKIGGKAIIQ